MDLSVVVTTKEELETLRVSVRNILADLVKLSGVESELVIVAPDELTQIFVQSLKNPKIRFIKDAGKEKGGKPAALLEVFAKTNSTIFILTDGDAVVSPGSVVKLFEKITLDQKYGLVTGQPISSDSRADKFGFWSHFLVTQADSLRRKQAISNQHIDASGYLYAVRQEVIDQIAAPVFAEILADDGYISQLSTSLNLINEYEPGATVKLAFPKNFDDWIKQKKRATGGYMQLKQIFVQAGIKKGSRNFWLEVWGGLVPFFTFPKTFKELWWLLQLYLTRLYLWVLIFKEVKLQKRQASELWGRVESTKAH